MLHYAWDHSPFYQKYYREHGIERSDLASIPIEKLPFTDKHIIMENLDEVFTTKDLCKKDLEDWLRENTNPRDLYKGKYVVLHTSGSTGSPSIIVYDFRTWNIVMSVGSLRTVSKKHPFIRPIRGAYLTATHGHFAGVTLAVMTPKYFYDLLIISVMDPIEKIVDEINAFQPEHIFGYPAVVNDLAIEAAQKRLNVSPSLVVTSGEPLTEEVAKRVNEAWNVAPRDIYISTEGIFHALRFSFEDGFFVFDDLNYTEFLNIEGEKSKEIVFTNLFNKVLPLIRYKIHDRVEIKEALTESTVKWPFSRFYKLEGRSYNPIVVQSNSGKSENIHPIVLVEFYIPGIEDIQFIKENSTSMRIKYVSSTDLDKEIGEKFKALLAQKKVDEAVKVTIERVPKIPPEANGKTPFIKILEE